MGLSFNMSDSLIKSVLDWWEEHKNDVCLDYNLYDEKPEFVKNAESLKEQKEALRNFKVSDDWD